MKKISEAVREILLASDTATEAIRANILNLSAYADSIRPQVEALTWKEVKPGSITVSLFRLQKELKSLAPLRPVIRIQDLTIQTDLCDLSFEKTEKILQQLPSLQASFIHAPRTVFAQTVGMTEVTFIASAQIKDQILFHVKQKPKRVYDNLVGISIGFDSQYLSVPNTIYALISSVATKRINIIEIVSTLTELMIVVDQQDRERCVKALEKHFQATS